MADLLSQAGILERARTAANQAALNSKDYVPQTKLLRGGLC